MAEQDDGCGEVSLEESEVNHCFIRGEEWQEERQEEHTDTHTYTVEGGSEQIAIICKV